MQPKIIHFPKGYFIKNKQHALTPLMIDALLAACEKQEEGVPFGPADIKGSFAALVSRGLIIRKQVTLNHVSELAWHVTGQAISMLKTLGIIVACGDIGCPKTFSLSPAYL